MRRMETARERMRRTRREETHDAVRYDEELRCQFARALLESSKSVAFECQPIRTDRN